MATIYDEYPIDISAFPAEAEQEAQRAKQCPGLQQFCPHYIKGVCDVKYRECVLFNSLNTSMTILRMERENLLKHPTAQNLEWVAHINAVLREENQEPEVDAAAIFRDKLKGRLVAALLFALVILLAVILYIVR